MISDHTINKLLDYIENDKPTAVFTIAKYNGYMTDEEWESAMNPAEMADRNYMDAKLVMCMLMLLDSGEEF